MSMSTDGHIGKFWALWRSGCTFFGLLATTSQGLEIVAHRGGYALAPENTVAAFHSCVGHAEWIEFDVRECADGHLVVIHDNTVDRTTDGTGSVASMTLAQIRSLDAGSKFSSAFVGEPVPTLAEALQSIPLGIRPIIDRKTGSAADILDAIIACGAESTVIVSSADMAFLGDVRSRHAHIALSLIGSGTVSPSTLDWMMEIGIYSIAWEKSTITPELIDMMRGRGIRVFGWSFDSIQTRIPLNAALDAIMVNDPRLASLLNNEKKPSNSQLAKGLCAYWKLDEGDAGGLDMIDVEGASHGLLGEADNTPMRILRDAPRMGGAVMLDGIQNYIAISTNIHTDIGTNAATLSLWVNLATLPSKISESYSGIYDSEQDAYILYMDRAARELRFKLTDVSNQYARVGIPEALLSTGVWHHIAGVYEGSASPAAGQAMIYLDGRLVAVTTGSAISPRCGLVSKIRPGQIAAIGRNGALNHSYFQGAVDDIAIWGRALQPTEVRHIHAAGNSGRPLEDLIMSIRISAASPINSNQAELRFKVAHAIAADRQFRLGYAQHPAGSYTEQPADLTIEGNSVRCQIQFSNPVGTPPRFYRIESP
jgi:glycerophosphoryl diester phosphodiesterase